MRARAVPTSSGAMSHSVTVQPQLACRGTTPPLTNTSATAQAVQRPVDKAIYCKPAERRRQHPPPVQVLRQRPPRPLTPTPTATATATPTTATARRMPTPRPGPSPRPRPHSARLGREVLINARIIGTATSTGELASKPREFPTTGRATVRHATVFHRKRPATPSQRLEGRRI